MLNASHSRRPRPRPPSHRSISSQRRINFSRWSSKPRDEQEVVVQDQLTRVEKMEANTQKAELWIPHHIVNFPGHRVDRTGQRVSLHSSLPLSHCSVWSLIRGKQGNHQPRKLFTPDYDHHRVSGTRISSSHLSLSLSLFTIIESPPHSHVRRTA